MGRGIGCGCRRLYAKRPQVIEPKCVRVVSFCGKTYDLRLSRVTLSHGWRLADNGRFDRDRNAEVFVWIVVLAFRDISSCMAGNLALEKAHSIRRIALLLGQDLGYCRDVERGVLLYSQLIRDWVFRDAPPSVDVLKPLRDWKPHGIICHLYLPELARRLGRFRCPIVNTTNTLATLKFPLVENDHLEIGRMGAEHFLERGYRNFGFFGSGWAQFSLDRESGFRKRLQAEGLTVSSCYMEYLPRPPADVSWKRIDSQLRQWLTELPRPVAILASNDVPARHLADACLALGLKVPEEVAILGVDNDVSECGLARPPLSSIAVAGQRVGFEAAKMLDDLMHERPRPVTTVWVPPIRVETRQSTDTLAIDDPLVSSALALIRTHFSQDLGVDFLARQLATSRSKLERSFRTHLDRSILEEIHRVRIEGAKKLLSETSLPIGLVATRTGFSNARRLAVVFRQITGTTPTEFRRQSKPAEEHERL